MDDPTVLAAAISSPLSFLEALPNNVILDEIQRAQELFLPIKKIVDENRNTKRYLLTGSANVMTLPKIADSLAGRMSIHTLWTSSQGEINNHKELFINHCFQKTNRFPDTKKITWNKLSEKVTKGGYPEIQLREKDTSKYSWFDSYLTSILQRDISPSSLIWGIKVIKK